MLGYRALVLIYVSSRRSSYTKHLMDNLSDGKLSVATIGRFLIYILNSYARQMFSVMRRDHPKIIKIENVVDAVVMCYDLLIM